MDHCFAAETRALTGRIATAYEVPKDTAEYSEILLISPNRF
jgi:hypothetical protein